MSADFRVNAVQTYPFQCQLLHCQTNFTAIQKAAWKNTVIATRDNYINLSRFMSGVGQAMACTSRIASKSLGCRTIPFDFTKSAVWLIHDLTNGFTIGHKRSSERLILNDDIFIFFWY